MTLNAVSEPANTKEVQANGTIAPGANTAETAAPGITIVSPLANVIVKSWVPAGTTTPIIALVVFENDTEVVLVAVFISADVIGAPCSLTLHP